MSHFEPSSARGRVVLGLLAALFVVAAAGRARAADPFAGAERAFADGHANQAAAAMEPPAQERGLSAPVLYNLGNAYERQGRFGRAIASYQRAQLLAPRDRDLAANLALARAAANLPAPSPPWYRAAARFFSPAEWSWLLASAFCLACFALAAVQLQARGRRLLGSAAAVALLAGGISVAALAVAAPGRDDAVVVAAGGAPLRLSPFDSAAVESSVSEGEPVTVIARHGGFVRVRDARGQAGWADAAAIERILAPRS